MRTRIALAVLVAAALAVRLVLALDAPAAHIGGDPQVYDEIGVQIAQGNGWTRNSGAATAIHPPAWPGVLGAAYALTDHEDHLDVASTAKTPPPRGAAHGIVTTEHARWTAARVVNAVLGALAVALLGLIALELWGPAAGLIAAGLAAVYAPLAILGIALLSEPLFVALELFAVYAVLRARRGAGAEAGDRAGDRGGRGVRWAAPAGGAGRRARWAWLAGAGVATGLAVLTRANGAALLLPLALGAWTARPRFSRRALAAPAVVVAAAVLVVLPWSVRNASAMHSTVPVSTDLGQTLAGTYNAKSAQYRFRWRSTSRLPKPEKRQIAPLDEAAKNQKLTSLGLDYVKAHPAAVAKAAFYNTTRLLEIDPVGRSNLAGELASNALATVSFAGFAIFALLAVGGALTNRVRRATPRWIWLAPLVMWLGTVPFAVNFDRFRAPIDPFLILLAAAAVATAAERALPLASRAWPRPRRTSIA